MAAVYRQNGQVAGDQVHRETGIDRAMTENGWRTARLAHVDDWEGGNWVWLLWNHGPGGV